MKYKENWINELEADNIGLNLLLKSTLNPARSITYMAALLFLALGYTADRYYEIVNNKGTPISTTHPPFAIRLESIYEKILKESDDKETCRQLYEQFGFFTENLINSIKNI